MTVQSSDLITRAAAARSAARQRVDGATDLVDRVVRSPRAQKLFRYALTSGVATGISEVTLLALYASGFLGATGSAVVANLAGTVPSYLLSRYWIWPEADRGGAARQMGLYWSTSVISLVVTTAGTSLAGAHAPAGHTAHVIVVGSAYIGTVAILWVAKFLVYQRYIFSSAPVAETAGSA
ncbi:MAG: GtrA family protein [Candidatus Dormiibacterota bacterium]